MENEALWTCFDGCKEKLFFENTVLLISNAQKLTRLKIKKIKLVLS